MSDQRDRLDYTEFDKYKNLHVDNKASLPCVHSVEELSQPSLYNLHSFRDIFSHTDDRTSKTSYKVLSKCMVDLRGGMDVGRRGDKEVKLSQLLLCICYLRDTASH